MADSPVGTAVSNYPELSVLVTAMESAGLVDTLNSAEEITLLAPSNEAFARLDPGTLDEALADPKGRLTELLTYHVVPGTVAPEALAGNHTTLHGGTMAVAASGQDFTVNNSAKVVCGNVKTANAIVYIIDSVLVPPR